jgi:ferritin-like metal-binding protein YciE
MSGELWNELVDKFITQLIKSIESLKQRDVETIPGAKDQLVTRLEQLSRFLPKENGKMLIKSIDESICNAFFPNTNDLADAFQKILKARTHEQDFIINELINGFIASQSKAFGSFKQGPIVDRLIEGFKKSKQFRIADYTFFAMFGDPNKPRKAVQEELEQLANFLGLVKETYVIKKDVRKSQEKIINFYTFPPKIRELMEGTYIQTTDQGETLITEEFDKNVFICSFLARYSVDRYTLDAYKINGISAIFALILIISLMPKVKISEDNPINRDEGFNPESMSVIPKSWMMKEILMELLPPLIEIIAYRLGATKWYEKIEKSDAQKRLHLQTRFLLKDVNKWVLGNMVRVEIPVFVEISNIFQEITVGTDAKLENQEN